MADTERIEPREIREADSHGGPYEKDKAGLVKSAKGLPCKIKPDYGRFRNVAKRLGWANSARLAVQNSYRLACQMVALK